MNFIFVQQNLNSQQSLVVRYPIQDLFLVYFGEIRYLTMMTDTDIV